MTASERPYVTLFKQLLIYMKESLDELRPTTLVTHCGIDVSRSKKYNRDDIDIVLSVNKSHANLNKNIVKCSID